MWEHGAFYAGSASSLGSDKFAEKVAFLCIFFVRIFFMYFLSLMRRRHGRRVMTDLPLWLLIISDKTKMSRSSNCRPPVLCVHCQVTGSNLLSFESVGQESILGGDFLSGGKDYKGSPGHRPAHQRPVFRSRDHSANQRPVLRGALTPKTLWPANI